MGVATTAWASLAPRGGSAGLETKCTTTQPPLPPPMYAALRRVGCRDGGRGRGVCVCVGGEVAAHLTFSSAARLAQFLPGTAAQATRVWGSACSRGCSLPLFPAAGVRQGLPCATKGAGIAPDSAPGAQPKLSLDCAEEQSCQPMWRGHRRWWLFK